MLEKQLITPADIANIDTVLGLPKPAMSLIPTADERKFFDSRHEDSFLPSLKLLQGTSPELAENDGRNKSGDFYLSVLNRNVGQKVIVCVCDRRVHALLMENGRKSKESFNYNSPIFQLIMSISSTKDQSIRSSWSVGDFLCWLPEENVFCTFFPGVRALRPVAFDLIDYMTTPKERVIESKRDLLHTNCFEFTSFLQNFGPRYRCMVVKLTPLDVERSLFPESLALKSVQEIFIRPVINEQKVEKVNVSGEVGR